MDSLFVRKHCWQIIGALKPDRRAVVHDRGVPVPHTRHGHRSIRLDHRACDDPRHDQRDAHAHPAFRVDHRDRRGGGRARRAGRGEALENRCGCGRQSRGHLCAQRDHQTHCAPSTPGFPASRVRAGVQFPFRPRDGEHGVLRIHRLPAVPLLAHRARFGAPAWGRSSQSCCCA